MADAEFVQGDRLPDMTATLHPQGSATGTDLTTASSVRFQMRKANDRRYTVNQPAEFVDRSAGQVRYQWAVNDLAVPGTYEVQWEVTWSDGKPQTTYNPRTIDVRRQ